MGDLIWIDVTCLWDLGQQLTCSCGTLEQNLECDGRLGGGARAGTADGDRTVRSTAGTHAAQGGAYCAAERAVDGSLAVREHASFSHSFQNRRSGADCRIWRSTELRATDRGARDVVWDFVLECSERSSAAARRRVERDGA